MHLHVTYATRQTIMYSCDTISTYNNRYKLGAKKKKNYPHTYSSSETTGNVSIFRWQNFIEFYGCDNCIRRELMSRHNSAGKMATETNADALYCSRPRTNAFRWAAITRVSRMLSFERLQIGWNSDDNGED